MKLRLLLNIGKDDARRLELDRTLAGEVVSVKQEVADELLRNCWATEASASDEVRERADVKATPSGSAALEPAFDSMTKEDLKAYADEHKVPGVHPSMTKDDMVRAIRKAGPAR
jgi:DnaJ-domain-containing protein 1